MDRRDFLGLVAAGGAAMVGSSGYMSAATTAVPNPAAPARRRRPNVLFIITDDQPRSSFGFLGGQALTPNIDRLASEGVYFERGYVASAVCTPSRFCCLTGKYASRCRDRSFLRNVTPEGQTRVLWNTNVGPDRPSLPQVLREAGYVTGIVGKCHGISSRGYQQVPADSDPADPDVAEILRQNQERLAEDVKQCGFDYAASLYVGNLPSNPCAALRQHNMEWITKGALDFVEQSKDRPFYLYFSTTLLHGPSPLKSLQSDPRITEAGLLDAPLQVQPSRESVLERAKAAGIKQRLAAATWLDDGVGAVLDKLDELGLAEDTLVFYFNDHGVEGGKGSCYEHGVRTPTIIRWRGSIEPGHCDQTVQNIDFAPTILDACGIGPPADMHIDGRSLLPLLTGRSVKWRDSLYFELGYTRAVSDGRWKYIAFRIPPSGHVPLEERLQEQRQYVERARQRGMPDRILQEDPEARITHLGGTPGGDDTDRWQGLRVHAEHYYDPDQLYDLQNDPDEQNNLAGDLAHAAKLAEMRALLANYLADLPGTFGEFKTQAD